MSRSFSVARSGAVALDCEMIAGRSSNTSPWTTFLAHVAIVDETGEAIYNQYVKPPVWATEFDYRTEKSGIGESTPLSSARSFGRVRGEVLSILNRATVVVGHYLTNDFNALVIEPDPKRIYNTAKREDFMRRTITGKLESRKLVNLAYWMLKRNIQVGVHNALEDAKAAMDLYLKYGKSETKAGGSRKKRCSRKTRRQPQKALFT